MTRREAIETVDLILTELNKTPEGPGQRVNLPEFLVRSLIELGILIVDDEDIKKALT